MPCLVCGSKGTTVGHHIITRGAGGPDEDWNLMPLCTECHREIHDIGTGTFVNKYVYAKAFMIHFNWQHNKKDNKWYRLKS